jgi:GNAT superfamily N-acetyltransferase
VDIPEHVLRLAESLNSYMPLGPGEERIERPGWAIWLGTERAHPAFTVVQRLRLDGADVASAVAEVRALLAARGRTQASWEVGPSATPGDLVERLLAQGMARYEEPTAWGMVLRRPLPPTAGAVVARRAATLDDYLDGYAVLNRVFGERVETPDERRARAERALAQGDSGRALFVATLDGETVAAASALYADGAVVLSGSATLPHARGRGAYRALVAARYADAVARGTPTLVIQAGAMSRPILARLGFETVAEVHILLDASPT